MFSIIKEVTKEFVRPGAGIVVLCDLGIMYFAGFSTPEVEEELLWAIVAGTLLLLYASIADVLDRRRRAIRGYRRLAQRQHTGQAAAQPLHAGAVPNLSLVEAEGATERLYRPSRAYKS